MLRPWQVALCARLFDVPLTSVGQQAYGILTGLPLQDGHLAHVEAHGMTSERLTGDAGPD